MNGKKPEARRKRREEKAARTRTKAGAGDSSRQTLLSGDTRESGLQDGSLEACELCKCSALIAAGPVFLEKSYTLPNAAQDTKQTRPALQPINYSPSAIVNGCALRGVAG